MTLQQELVITGSTCFSKSGNTVFGAAIQSSLLIVFVFQLWFIMLLLTFIIIILMKFQVFCYFYRTGSVHKCFGLTVSDGVGLGIEQMSNVWEGIVGFWWWLV